MENQFRKELAETAKQLVRRGFGILAADESNPTLGKKFDPLGIPNEPELRRQYRQMLFTTPELDKHISGVILFDETARQSADDGTTFIDLLKKRGIIPGIKVDKGVQPINGTKGETWTAGLDDLEKRCKEYYGMGIRFAKWRAVLKIDEADHQPSELSMQDNAWGLAKYASICQANGLCPIVEPEILADGKHSIEVCQRVTERVNQIVFKALTDNHIFFEGMLLKPNMVTAGTSCPDKSKVTPEEIGLRTAIAMSRSVLPSVPGIVFLSGGMSEEEASLNLNAANRVKDVKVPFALSFSFGRALQNTAVKTWAGKKENVQIAQEKFLARAKAHSEAQLGKYEGGGSAESKESLFVAGYKY